MKKGGSRLLNAIGGAGPLAVAKTLRKAGKHEAAVKALESYLAVSPLDEDGNLLLGQSLEEAGYFRSARAVYEFLAEIAPKRAEGLKRAGAMSARHGDHEKALDNIWAMARRYGQGEGSFAMGDRVDIKVHVERVIRHR